MNSGPLPTRLIFLNELPHIEQGSKVRFLGCVTKYTTSTGILHLRHSYTPTASKGSLTIALVDVGLLLSTLKSTDVEVGAWVNVVGYVDFDSQTASPVDNRKQKGTGKEYQARVQALMLWSAGSLKVGEYENVLGQRHETELQGK